MLTAPTGCSPPATTSATSRRGLRGRGRAARGAPVHRRDRRAGRDRPGDRRRAPRPHDRGRPGAGARLRPAPGARRDHARHATGQARAGLLAHRAAAVPGRDRRAPDPRAVPARAQRRRAQRCAGGSCTTRGRRGPRGRRAGLGGRARRQRAALGAGQQARPAALLDARGRWSPRSRRSSWPCARRASPPRTWEGVRAFAEKPRRAGGGDEPRGGWRCRSWEARVDALEQRPARTTRRSRRWASSKLLDGDGPARARRAARTCARAAAAEADVRGVVLEREEPGDLMLLFPAGSAHAEAGLAQAGAAKRFERAPRAGPRPRRRRRDAAPDRRRARRGPGARLGCCWGLIDDAGAAGARGAVAQGADLRVATVTSSRGTESTRALRAWLALSRRTGGG